MRRTLAFTGAGLLLTPTGCCHRVTGKANTAEGSPAELSEHRAGVR
ncbi:hypothetical protein [Streptacidiphilus sp. EB103A]